jgi:hypothetical protein
MGRQNSDNILALGGDLSKKSGPRRVPSKKMAKIPKGFRAGPGGMALAFPHGGEKE